jgi:hypothetical protein
MNDAVIGTAAHVVQLALTPAFLLSGIAALLSVFATRFGRIADQVELLTEKQGSAETDVQLERLRLRSVVLDWAVILAAVAGAFTCASVLVLFFGGLGGFSGADLLYFLFCGATVLTMGSLVAFATEMLLAARSVRRKVDRSVGDPESAAVASGPADTRAPLHPPRTPR